jgi:hypothetical protein
MCHRHAFEEEEVMKIKTNLRAGSGGRCAGGGSAGGSTGGGSGGGGSGGGHNSTTPDPVPVYVAPVSRCVGA